MTHGDYSVLDEALVILKSCGPEYHGGFSNHAPMAAEALCAMDRADAVIPWVDRYRRNLVPAPSARERITADEWRTALGRPSRFADWSAFFQDAFAESGWREASRLWLPRLAPGVVAAAAHGAIRVGHALRSLEESDTKERQLELANALAYWAAQYQTLPDSGANSAAHVRPSQAVSKVAILPEGQRRQFPSISEALSQLDDFAPFAAAASLVDSRCDSNAFISDLSATFARAYLVHATNVLGTIVFVHSVTGPCSLRPMLPYLASDATALALRYGWQAAAALLSIYATHAVPDRSEEESFDTEELIDRAVFSGDEHAIKFTEVCLREYQLNPLPEYLRAAQHVSSVLRAS